MSSNRRHGAGRLIIATLALWATLHVPGAMAQTNASLTISPAEAAPGEPIIATLFIPSSIPVDAAVSDHVWCTLAGSTACEWRGEPVTLRIIDGGTEYTLFLVAPNLTGAHEMTIIRAPFADMAVGSQSATATLTVVPLPEIEEPLDDAALDADGDAPTDPAASRAADALRWLVSSTTGTATLLVLLVGSRAGMGGFR